MFNKITYAEEEEEVEEKHTLYSSAYIGKPAAMAAALNISREEVRMLVMEVGCTEAAKRMGIPLNTVLSWSARGKWLQPVAQKLPPTVEPRAITAIKAPADALAEYMAEHDGKSKAGYALVSSKLAGKFADMDPDKLIACTPAVKDGVTIADKTFGWTAQREKAQSNPLLLLSITGCPSVTVQGNAPAE